MTGLLSVFASALAILKGPPETREANTLKPQNAVCIIECILLSVERCLRIAQAVPNNAWTGASKPSASAIPALESRSCIAKRPSLYGQSGVDRHSPAGAGPQAGSYWWCSTGLINPNG